MTTTTTSRGSGRVIDLRKLLDKIRVNQNDPIGYRIAKVLAEVADAAPYQFVPMALLTKVVLILPKVPFDTHENVYRVRSMMSSVNSILVKKFEKRIDHDRATGGVRATVDAHDFKEVTQARPFKRAYHANEKLSQELTVLSTMKGLTGEDKRWTTEALGATKRLLSPAVKALLKAENEDES